MPTIGDLVTIDAHQHFWSYSQEQYPWIVPGMERLMRDYLPPDLLPHLKATGVDGTVVVQARSTWAETEWLLALAAQTPFIKAVVGWADPRDEQLGDRLESVTNSKLAGLRYELQDQDETIMRQPAFVDGLDILHNYDLTFDFLIRPRHLPAAYQIAHRYPRQRFVIDHIAKPLISQGVMQPWADDMRRIAQLPNVFCKVSGVVTQADWTTWQPEHLTPYLDVVFEAFRPARLLFGSDWPVCTLAAPYERVHSLVIDYIQRCSRSEQKLIMGENARQCYYYYRVYS
jgi:L-fuconolactonase